MPQNTSQISCEYLLAYRGAHEADTRVKPHSHSFWQFDLCIQGGVNIVTERVSMTLSAGDVAILPPAVVHQLTYAEYSLFAVLKFRAKGIAPALEPMIGHQSQAVRGLNAVVLALLPTEGAEPDEQGRAILEHAFAAILAAHANPLTERVGPMRPQIIQQIRTYVRRQAGRYITVDELARAIGYSASHTSAEYRKHEKESLKSYLDRSRAETALRLVKYSDYSIPEVAEKLEFPDLQSFSRFIRRLTGKPPRDHR